ncbi:MAG: glycosyltransferase family 39 protein [Anaerolineae bacterium]
MNARTFAYYYRWRLIGGMTAAVICSLWLTAITLTAPQGSGDWARLDASGRYTPPVLNGHGRIMDCKLRYGQEWWPVGATFRSEKPTRKAPKRRTSFPIYIVVSVITLLGFGLRLFSLGDLPLIVDEIGFAARASDILHGQHIAIFAPGHNGNPATFSWLVTGAMALWGQNTFAIRLLPLACGTLSIPAAFVLGRVWWGRQVGLLAAGFLAVFPAHVYFSRLALYNVIDPLLVLLALAVLARGLRSGRSADFVAAGVLAGSAQYFYHGARLLVVLMAVYSLWESGKRLVGSG